MEPHTINVLLPHVTSIIPPLLTPHRNLSKYICTWIQLVWKYAFMHRIEEAAQHTLHPSYQEQPQEISKGVSQGENI